MRDDRQTEGLKKKKKGENLGIAIEEYVGKSLLWT